MKRRTITEIGAIALLAVVIIVWGNLEKNQTTAGPTGAPIDGGGTMPLDMDLNSVIIDISTDKEEYFTGESIQITVMVTYMGKTINVTGIYGHILGGTDTANSDLSFNQEGTGKYMSSYTIPTDYPGDSLTIVVKIYVEGVGDKTVEKQVMINQPTVPECQLDVDCDDDYVCTIDKCVEGVCVNDYVDCDDGNPCTLDGCKSNIFTPDHVECVNTKLNEYKECDWDLCTLGDECVNGVCVSGNEWDPTCGESSGNPNGCEVGGECTTNDGCPGEYDGDCECIDIPDDNCPIDSDCYDHGYTIRIDPESPYFRPGQEMGAVAVYVKDNQGGMVSKDTLTLYVKNSSGDVVYSKGCYPAVRGEYLCYLSYVVPMGSGNLLRIRAEMNDRGLDICREEEFPVRCKYLGDCDDGNGCTEDKCDDGVCENNPFTDVSEGICDDGDDCTLGDYCEEGECRYTSRNPDCLAEVTPFPMGNISLGGNDSTGDEGGKDSSSGGGDEEVEEGGEEDVGYEVEGNETGGETGLEVIEYEEENYTISVELVPNETEFEPGETIGRAIVHVKDSSGYVDAENVSGYVDGVLRTEMQFSKVQVGEYSSQLDYVIASDEKSVLPLVFNVKVGEQEIEKTIYLLIKSKEYFYLVVNSPRVKAVAPGQEILFEVELSKPGYEQEMENANVTLIDERSDEEFEMVSGSPIYSTELTIPKNIYDSAYFLIWAKVVINGTERDNAERIMLKKDTTLSVIFDKDSQNMETGVFGVDVRYISGGGELVKDNRLNATITGYPSMDVQRMILQKSGDLFMGVYKRRVGDTSAEIEVVDAYGNSGEADLPPELFKKEVPPVSWEYILIILVIVVVGVLLFSFRSAIVGRREIKETEEKNAETRKEELEGLVKRAKLDFYKRRITEEEANKRINEYKEELKKID